jgi:hypothetical protein
MRMIILALARVYRANLIDDVAITAAAAMVR